MEKTLERIVFASLLMLPLVLPAQTPLRYEPSVKQRLFVLTGITNEPDDQESLVRLLVCANEVDLEGIVATTSTFMRHQVRRDKIEELVHSYGNVKANLDLCD